MATQTNVVKVIPNAWALYKRQLPDGYKVITDKQALDPQNRVILTSARAFIDRNVKANAPIGHQEFKTMTVSGKPQKVLFIVEPHFHEPGGKTFPWGWHKGGTVFLPPPDDYWSFLYDESDASFGAEDAVTKAAARTAMVKRYGLAAIVGAPIALLGAPILGGLALVGLAVADPIRRFQHGFSAFKGIPPSLPVHEAAVAQQHALGLST